jgi:glycosyltransferase involved in cell wall biosynthesis
MSRKKAIIATNIGGLKDMVRDGENGILVPPDAPDKLAEAMSYLLREPEVASRMGERGYAMLTEKYLPDTVIPEIVKVYRSLL